ncbi:hypothetical protein EVAR_77751_1 [Eumeta japonica]|uniref:RNA-directed DNA polymerase from transposon BS n=1 Tax=Eumeta variegata TaxID=151549 RepID=A0A4C1TEA1_EUMVA|nr:hypothetical protein EVAR_77751_1 [Eumeta japonica]
MDDEEIIWSRYKQASNSSNALDSNPAFDLDPKSDQIVSDKRMTLTPETQNFKNARKELLDLQEKEDEEKCQHFFSQMHRVHRSQRMKMAYEFLRNFKKQTGRKQPKRFIPIFTWIHELHKVKGPDFRISQNDKKVIKLPSTDDIRNIIKQIKKGTAPGPDQMVIELYQHATNVFGKQVTKIIGKVCESNSFPQEWVEAIQIPIPKKARLLSVND